MARDLWNTTDLPLLRAFGEVAEEEPLNPLLSPQVAQDRAGLADLSFDEIIASVQRLEQGGLLHATLYRAGGGVWSIVNISGLTEKGLRAVGAWPSDDLLSALLAVLEERESAEDDPEVKTLLQRIRDALRSLGPQVATGLLVNFVSRVSGGW